MTPKHC